MHLKCYIFAVNEYLNYWVIFNKIIIKEKRCTCLTLNVYTFKFEDQTTQQSLVYCLTLNLMLRFFGIIEIVVLTANLKDGLNNYDKISKFAC